ncbi:MAG TPA: AAA family ATPase, partial [Cryptosporangiaceae bacterium]|nr:AAA family ATPase [Cryptosporangiaceae bacterium]
MTRLVAADLVGREAELSVLVQVVTSPPAIALVAGEPGVGKTRLVQELLRRPDLDGRAVLVGHCHPLREPFPFGPVVEALADARHRCPRPRDLTAVTGALRPLLPELDDWLPPPLPSTGDARLDRHRLFRAVPELLGGLGPVVLVLEDLHWVDPTTLELLTFLARQLPSRATLLLTQRDTGPSATAVSALGDHADGAVSFTRLSLAPLDEAEVQQLTKAIVGIEGVSREFARCLHDRTGGLPFAVEEVLGLLRGRRDIVAGDGRTARRVFDGLGVPTLMRYSFLERLDRLRPATRRIVYAAAVLQVPSGQDVLTAVAGLSDTAGTGGIGEALGQGLLRPVGDERYALRHALAAQAVYDSLPVPQRRQLHARAVRALKTVKPTPHAQLAHHCRIAGRIAEWWRHAEAASDAAFQLGDYPAATEFLRQALTATGQPQARRNRLALKLARTAPLGLSHADLVPLLRRILDEEELPAARRGELRVALGRILRNQVGQAAAGAAEIRRGITELRSRPDLMASALSLLSIPSLTPGHLRDHLDTLERATRLLPRVSDPARRAAILNNQAATLLSVGDPSSWRMLNPTPTPSESAALRVHDVTAAHNAASGCVFLGYYGKAERWLQETTRRVERANVDYVKAIGGSIGAHLAWATGRWPEVEGWLRQAASSDDVAVVAADVSLLGGLLALARGDLDAAEHDLRSGRWAEPEERVWAAEASVNAGGLIRLWLARGETGRAATHAAWAVRAVRDKGVWVWAAELAAPAVAALLGSAQGDLARALVAEFRDGLAGRDAPVAAAALTLAQAQLAEADHRYAEAGEGFSEAAAAYRKLPRP